MRHNFHSLMSLRSTYLSFCTCCSALCEISSKFVRGETWSGMLLYNKETEDSMRETHTEGLHKAGAVNQGLTGTSKRLTIGSSLYTQEDGISILMRYKLENRQKKTIATRGLKYMY